MVLIIRTRELLESSVHISQALVMSLLFQWHSQRLLLSAAAHQLLLAKDVLKNKSRFLFRIRL